MGASDARAGRWASDVRARKARLGWDRHWAKLRVADAARTGARRWETDAWARKVMADWGMRDRHWEELEPPDPRIGSLMRPGGALKEYLVQNWQKFWAPSTIPIHFFLDHARQFCQEYMRLLSRQVQNRFPLWKFAHRSDSKKKDGGKKKKGRKKKRKKS